ncbi:hypothetical protein IVB03_14020 [Bradyrhizobium sp. 168]|uniref:hypothetical protein n=1 Tax=Bradyrhizobium sp. 168 TaxID=2782639 RepID=UPI001FF8DDF4|nr:hypothetical protein [Bradyrhizobium sp. 168]MCK1580668.1 hypothetical protein [Bradyrhizobium sp. 168]
MRQHRFSSKVIVAFSFLTIAAVSASACDLSPFSLKSLIAGSMAIGGIEIPTETRVHYNFADAPGGDIAMSRVIETALIQIEDSVVAQIDALSEKFPRNDCGAYARLSSRTAEVATPTFNVSGHIDGTFWTCLPGPEYPCSAFLSNIGEGFDDMYALAGLRIRTPRLNVPHLPPLSPMPPFLRPNNPLLNPPPLPNQLPIRMCRGKIKTKLASGSASINVVYSANIKNNWPVISGSPNVRSNTSTQTQFLGAFAIDPLLSLFTSKVIERKMDDGIKNLLNQITQATALPADQSGDPLEWSTRSARFDRKQYESLTSTIFRIAQEYNTDRSNACLYAYYVRNKP